MIPRHAKKVLKVINKIYRNTKIRSSDEQTYVSNLDIRLDLKGKKHQDETKKGRDIVNSINYLVEEKYVSKNRDGAVKPEYKGINYKEFSWIETKSYIYKSVLVPIGVSIATVILINLLFK